MSFSYALDSTETIPLAIAKVRLELGDNVLNGGVKPDGSNFTDEEITMWLGEESNHVQKTVARACDALSRLWATVANITVGPRREDLGKVSDEWSKRAAEIRMQYSRTIQPVAITRV